jgi:REP element-mobilizing transposase RayT
MVRRAQQLELRFHRGGKRPRAGRKPKGERAGVTHATRPQFARSFPVHVTIRMAAHVWNLRSRRAFRVVGPAIALAAERFGMRIVHFSVQGNHVHLIVEATETKALSRAMQGFSVRVARGLNRMMGRRGRVLGDRFHAHVLRTPTETRRAVAYVRNNYRKHFAELGKPISPRFVDEYSSDGAEVDLAAPGTWLLKQAVGPPTEVRATR